MSLEHEGFAFNLHDTPDNRSLQRGLHLVARPRVRLPVRLCRDLDDPKIVSFACHDLALFSFKRNRRELLEWLPAWTSGERVDNYNLGGIFCC